LALTCGVSIGSNPDNIVDIVKDYPGIVDTEDLMPEHITYLTKVLVNGDWIGSHSEPYKLLNHLRDQRRKGVINYSVSITFDSAFNEIKVFTDSGRFIRPVFIVENNKLLITPALMDKIRNKEVKWYDLLTNNNLLKRAVIEYLDPAEEENSLIAMDSSILGRDELKVFSHCEINPNMVLGIAATTIPFIGHNQAPRNCYGAGQCKQAIGIPVSNFNVRYDKFLHVLHYPQAPIVMTRGSKYFNLDQIPGGINVMLAMASYSGFNQEDSLMMNKGSVDRGLFRSTYYVTLRDDLSKGNKEYGKPDPNNTIKIRNHSFRHIEDSGFIKKDVDVEPNDVIIGKIQKTDKTNQVGDGKQLYTDESITLRDMGLKDKKVTVDQVIVSQNGDGYPFVKVRLRKNRIPKIGDKYSARNGQKGTIGMTMAHEDMPFNKDGISPDIVMNPHAIPKRCTIGQFLEILYSKVGAIQGIQYDGSGWSGQDMESISDVLEKLGFNRYGNEVLYNGMTGEQLPVDIFMGPCYYQKLKHMVDDKYHSRSIGPVSMLTRQPLEGRSKDGGLRYIQCRSVQ
jgi:DNA-directed RNA polymerase II subunit RPB2